jgi:hypothetical protein
MDLCSFVSPRRHNLECVQTYLQDERQLHSLMDALAVAEFLATFAAVCGAPLLNLAQLQQAVAWPLDGPELFETYSSLVKYLLAQWVSEVRKVGKFD